MIQHTQIKWSYWLFPLAALLGVFGAFQANGFLELALQEPEKIELVFSSQKENQKSVLLLNKPYHKTLFVDFIPLVKQQQLALFNYNHSSEVIYNVINHSFLSYKSTLFDKKITYNFPSKKNSKYTFRSIVG